MFLGKAISIKISKRTLISVYNVPFTLLENNEESYSLNYQDKQFKLSIKLVGKNFIFIKNIIMNNKVDKKSRRLPPFFISKNDDQTIDLGIRINTSKIVEYDFTKGPLLIEEEHKERGSFTIEIKEIPTDLFKKNKRNQKVAEKPQRQKSEKLKEELKKEQEKKEHINELVKKLDEYEAKYRDSSIKQEKDLTSKGVYLTHPDAYKRCENCANNTGSKCSVHNVEVSDNHRCSRFYSYKTVYGGGFSPR